MIAIWLIAIHTVIIATHVHGLQVRQGYPDFVPARVRVGTFVYAAVTFFVILYLTRRWGWKVALARAVIGTAAAPMIFKLPFDPIVMARANPPIPAHPMLYRQLFFLPLFLAQLSTLLMLTLLPSMRVTASACYAVAAMFVVFAVWAAFGFAFPATLLPLALNVISKILCFVAAIMLLVWREDAEGRLPEGDCADRSAPRGCMRRDLSTLQSIEWLGVSVHARSYLGKRSNPKQPKKKITISSRELYLFTLSPTYERFSGPSEVFMGMV
jgi:hypothetical protein